MTIQIVQGEARPAGRFRLDKRPDALYIVNVESDGRSNILGIKSTGDCVFEYEFGLA